jgi:hypothetical protein
MADMTITNQTVRDYTFGPYHLPAGSGQQITIDTTTSASLYLIDDAVADIVNQLYALGYITVSNQPTPFPRVTGVPAILHGDGNPEGIVFAPQASSSPRRALPLCDAITRAPETPSTPSPPGSQSAPAGNPSLALSF